MHHDPRRRTFGIEHIKNVVVSVPIMEYESLVEGLGDGDVRRKCISLHGLTCSIGRPVVIQSRLPDCSYARMLGQRLHQLQTRQQLRPHPRSIVRVDSNAGDHRWPVLGGLDGPAATFRITSDLNDSRDAHFSGHP
jgi:hypothetical protein